MKKITLLLIASICASICIGGLWMFGYQEGLTDANTSGHPLLQKLSGVKPKPEQVSDPIPEKPFIVIDKFYPNVSGKVARYKYVDRNGKIFAFDDESTMFHVGDTLK